MNGFIKRTAAVVVLGSAAALPGCCKDATLGCYDNCWLERYSYQAKQSEMQTFDAQVNNGHVLDQTVFAYHFDARHGQADQGRPGAPGLPGAAPSSARPEDLFADGPGPALRLGRAGAIQQRSQRTGLQARGGDSAFLNADTAGRPMAFEVIVHDAPTPGLATQPIGNAVQRHYDSFTGSLATGTAAGGGGGAATPR